MEEPKSKKNTRRAPKAGNAPIPHGVSTCGHSGCQEACAVRFVGPVTNVRDHHIVHAARGASQVWMASIAAGLAVVLTGAIAYTSVRAQSDVSDAGNSAILKQLSLLNRRLNTIEDTLRKHVNETSSGRQELQPPSTTQPLEAPLPTSCIAACSKTSTNCMKDSQGGVSGRKVCIEKMTACQKACEPAK